MALLLADINRAPEFRAFLDKIKVLCSEVLMVNLNNNRFNSISTSYKKFYEELFIEVDKIDLEKLVIALPNSLLNEIALVNKLLDWFKPNFKNAFETAEIVLDSIGDIAEDIHKPFANLLKELVQLSRLLLNMNSNSNSNG